ncbi:MAG: exodeoxyribonuclease VII large subunit [Bdellovibrionales bacterium]|nr:exodeoxyribonuclease VII large subunit [Bdellovibrionales bacterium]
MKQDFFSQFETQENSTYYSVSEVTKMIQDCLESSFSLLRLKGEISNFTAHVSGHWYFTLKDDFSQIRVVMFRSANQSLNWKPERGESLEVQIQGHVSVYKSRGEYQIICKSMEKCGKGAEEFEKLKEKLRREGLFERKKKLPFLPHHIVIISSPTGAAIRDILNVLKRRYKGVKVTLVPSLVQGKEAPFRLIEALKKARSLKTADVLILTRGGGSTEDLWAFNDEALAKTLFAFPLPIISAVGHEIDFTISDFVADMRAPTPSSAAELVVQNVFDLNEQIRKITRLLYQNMQGKIQTLKEKENYLRQHLPHPQKRIQDLQQYLDDLGTNLKRAFFQQTHLRKEKLSHLISLLESLSPLKILKRGYCLVNKNDKLIKKAHELKKGEEISIRFSQSFALACISQVGFIDNKNEKEK